MLKLALIANNYGKNYDGIGAFAAAVSENFSDNFAIQVYSSDCSENDSAFRRITTMGMTKAIFNAATKIQDKDAILLEYPFVEWNPCIIIAYLYLRKKCKRLKTKIFLSLHEYDRVNIMRRFVIRFLVRRADCVFVSNKKLGHDIQPYACNIRYRNIPTNIADNVENGRHDKNVFTYFGLINKTKAFDEMLVGWDIFNDAGTYTLNVITGTKISGLERHKNVNYYYNMSNKELLKKLRNAAFCVVPIRPNIDMKNGTFKTAAFAGCICIGRFSEEYGKLPFVIPMEKYHAEDFADAFCKAQKLSKSSMKKMEKCASMFGSQYTPKAVADTVEKEIVEFIGRKY